MSADVQSLVQTALTLSPSDRIVVAEKILESLDASDQTAVNAAWAHEAEDRLGAYERGELPGISYDEAMRTLRKDTAP